MLGSLKSFTIEGEKGRERRELKGGVSGRDLLFWNFLGLDVGFLIPS